MSVVPRYQLRDPSIGLTDELIMQHIDVSSRVIDLGCGDGRLMERLRSEMNCEVLGVDLEQSNVVSVIRRGLPIVAADLDEGLDDIPSGSFDFAVLSQTLQQVKQPRQLLADFCRLVNAGAAGPAGSTPAVPTQSTAGERRISRAAHARSVGEAPADSVV